jgi:uncharacterized protein YgbK (DUF1537 family)
MLIGVIADDFTGASDIANTLAKGGLGTIQFLDVPSEMAPATCQAGVVALKTRSIAAAEAVRQSLKALDWLRAQGAQQFVFKICSTFDSTPEGNIGPVGEALAAALGEKAVPVCPAFPATGRTVYRGHLFVGDSLLNESGMEKHPLNPMTDANLGRWLARQTKARIGLLPRAAMASVEAMRAGLAKAAEHGETFTIVDAIEDGDLARLGAACRDKRLLIGGSGIALGLPGNIEAAGGERRAANVWRAAPGDGAILSGSCSAATNRQVMVHAKAHPILAIDIDKVMDRSLGATDLAPFFLQNRGKMPLAYSTADPVAVTAAQARYGREPLARALDNLFASTAYLLKSHGFTRLVVAGGETSGAVMSILGFKALAIGAEIDPGVPALSTIAGRPFALALKSGNFGAEDFFEKALDRLAGATP